jgi:hypothetical protein
MAPGHLVLYHPSFVSSSAADLAEHRSVQVLPDYMEAEGTEA